MATDFDQSYTEYQTDRNFFRKLVRRAYLRSARTQLAGATLDFGCGVGELLSRLPEGSKGLEYNHATVEHCRRKGLDVDWYDGNQDGWKLSVIDPGRRFRSMLISHVLEHLDEPMGVLNRLLEAAAKLDIERVLVIVPGKAGYRIDDTHRTFVDMGMLSSRTAADETGFALSSARFFPGNWEKLGGWFPHHELQALYTRQ